MALEQVGRYTEYPFNNFVHDVSMTALCRTIEIDLRQMLGESELPLPVQPVLNGQRLTYFAIHDDESFVFGSLEAQRPS